MPPKKKWKYSDGSESSMESELPQSIHMAVEGPAPVKSETGPVKTDKLPSDRSLLDHYADDLSMKQETPTRAVRTRPTRPSLAKETGKNSCATQDPPTAPKTPKEQQPPPTNGGTCPKTCTAGSDESDDSNPLSGYEKLDAALFGVEDLSTLTELLNLQNLRIVGVFVSHMFLSTRLILELEMELKQLKQNVK